jgi:hypothetical protein
MAAVAVMATAIAVQGIKDNGGDSNGGGGKYNNQLNRG